MIRSDTDPRVPVCGFTIRSESIIRQSTVLGYRTILSEARKVAAARVQRWDSNTQAWCKRCNLPSLCSGNGIQVRPSEKWDPGVCPRCPEEGEKRKQEERDKQRATDWLQMWKEDARQQNEDVQPADVRQSDEERRGKSSNVHGTGKSSCSLHDDYYELQNIVYMYGDSYVVS